MLGWGIEYKRMEYKKGEKLYSSCMQQILVKHLLYAGPVHRTGIPHAPMVFWANLERQETSTMLSARCFRPSTKEGSGRRENLPES